MCAAAAKQAATDRLAMHRHAGTLPTSTQIHARGAAYATHAACRQVTYWHWSMRTPSGQHANFGSIETWYPDFALDSLPRGCMQVGVAVEDIHDPAMGIALKPVKTRGWHAWPATKTRWRSAAHTCPCLRVLWLSQSVLVPSSGKLRQDSAVILLCNAHTTQQALGEGT